MTENFLTYNSLKRRALWRIAFYSVSHNAAW